MPFMKYTKSQYKDGVAVIDTLQAVIATLIDIDNVLREIRLSLGFWPMQCYLF